METKEKIRYHYTLWTLAIFIILLDIVLIVFNNFFIKSQSLHGFGVLILLIGIMIFVYNIEMECVYLKESND